jgi:hypothetical protein
VVSDDIDEETEIDDTVLEQEKSDKANTEDEVDEEEHKY